MFTKRLVGMMLMMAWITAMAPAASAAEDKPAENYVQVKIKGTLETGIVVIGGETTGTVIRSGGVVWELDLGENAALKETATKLNKQTVVVTGRYHKRAGVEVPERHIVTVSKLKPAK